MWYVKELYFEFGYVSQLSMSEPPNLIHLLVGLSSMLLEPIPS